jgi:hypothetical protein
VGTIGGGRASARQPARDDMDDPADHLLVIDPRHTSRLTGQKRLQARKLRLCEPAVVIRSGKPSNVWEVESQQAVNGNLIYGS